MTDRSGKIDFKELKKLRIGGMTQNELAEHFGVTQSGVSRALKKLSVAGSQVVALEKAADIADRQINVVDQLAAINERAREILDNAEDPETTLKAAAEVRQQLRLQMDILKTMFDIEEVREFQRIVLEAVGSVAPETRKHIVDELQRRKLARLSFSVPRLDS